MIEFNLLILIFGFIVSSTRLGLANPFQIYFLVWGLLFLGYYATEELYIKPSRLFFSYMAVVHLLSTVILMAAVVAQKYPLLKRVCFSPVVAREKLLFVVNLASVVAVPFAYLKALELSNGVDILSVPGYIALRSSVTNDGQTLGVFSYLSLMALSAAALTIFLNIQNGGARLKIFAPILCTIVYGYLSTGRTMFLLFAVLSITPLVLRKYIGAKGLLASFLMLIFLFILIAAMTAKGISLDEDVGTNAVTLLENLTGYTVAPLIAFSTLFDGGVAYISYGENTFRFFIALVEKFDLIDVNAVALIREYAYVPMPTNVFTVYESYFKDFGYFAILVPPIFLGVHWWLYKNAVQSGGRWLFFYAASVYPLVMQFFQDQYTSLMSMWIQLAFWYFVLIKKSHHTNKVEVRTIC